MQAHYKVIFKKQLTDSEKRRHYIVVPASGRKHFLYPNQKIKVLINKKVREVELDRYWRLHLRSDMFHLLKLSRPGPKIVILTKKKDRDVYEIFVSDWNSQGELEGQH